MTVLDKIASHRAQVNAAALHAYSELILATDSGSQDIDGDEAVQILEAAGKTERDLAAAVSRLKQRRADALVACDLPKLAAAVDSMATEIEAAHEALRQAKEQHRLKIDDVVLRRGVLLSQHQVALAAHDRLLESSEDLKIIGAQRLLGAELMQLNCERDAILVALSNKPGTAGAEFARLASLARSAHASARSWFNSAGWFSPKNSAAIARENRDKFEDAYIVPLRKRLEPIEARLVIVNRELAELESAKLEV